MNEINVVVNQTPGKIECNFDEIEEALRVQMSAYAELEVTEENIPERKADVATLRKIGKAVDDERKAVKRTYNAPLDEFEAKVKKLTGIIDAEVKRIDGEIQAFDQKRIAEKQAHIQKLYEDHIGEYAEFLPLSVIRSEKWNNKTCTDKDIIFDISEKVTRVRSDLAAIKALDSEFEEKVIAAYKSSGNQLDIAMQRHAQYQEAKIAAEKALQEAAERKAREEAERAEKAAQEATKAEPVPVIDATTGETVGEVEFPMNPPTLTIRVTGEEDIEALRNFLDMSGIVFEEV